MNRFKTRSKAFTFIEVLVALAIASIGILGLLRLHLLSMATADAAQATSQAVFIAQEQIAEASARGFPEHGTDSGTVERNGLQFSWRTEVKDIAHSGHGDFTLKGVREISATVTWRQTAGEKTVKMTTLIADPRIHEQTEH